MELVRKIVAQTDEYATPSEAQKLLDIFAQELKAAEGRGEGIYLVAELTLIPTGTPKKTNTKLL